MTDYRDTLVRDVMRAPVITTTPDAPLREVARAIYDGEASCFVVDFGDSAEGHGIVTQKDIPGIMSEVGSDLEGISVADVMSHPMVFVPPTFSIRTCMLHMRMLGIRRAVVVEGTELVGLITFTDIFRHAVESGGSLT